MGVKKCPVSFCSESIMEHGTWCVTHTQMWCDSPEQKRAVAVGDQGRDQARLKTTMGDFTRRVEAEYLSSRRKDG